MMREKARLDARAKEEEELFARVPLSRVERKKLKQLKQSKNGYEKFSYNF
jgi:U3 small nucleolar ribonucleoprotein protein LCP5